MSPLACLLPEARNHLCLGSFVPQHPGLGLKRGKCSQINEGGREAFSLSLFWESLNLCQFIHRLQGLKWQKFRSLDQQTMQSWDAEQMTSDSVTGFKRIWIIWAREPADGRCLLSVEKWVMPSRQPPHRLGILRGAEPLGRGLIVAERGLPWHVGAQAHSRMANQAQEGVLCQRGSWPWPSLGRLRARLGRGPVSLLSPCPHHAWKQDPAPGTPEGWGQEARGPHLNPVLLSERGSLTLVPLPVMQALGYPSYLTSQAFSEIARDSKCKNKPNSGKMGSIWSWARQCCSVIVEEMEGTNHAKDYFQNLKEEKIHWGKETLRNDFPYFEVWMFQRPNSSRRVVTVGNKLLLKLIEAEWEWAQNTSTDERKWRD